MRQFYTCDAESCDLSSDGLTVTIELENITTNTMFFAINVIGYWVVPQHDYSYYWLPNPAVVPCEAGGVPLVFSGSIMPPWFYGSVTTDASFDGSGNVVINVHLSESAGKMEEVISFSF